MLWTYLVLCFLLVAGQFIGEFGILGQRIQVNALGKATNTPNGVVGYFQISFVLILALVPIWLAWAFYQVRNFIRSTGERRQQLKWVGAGATICLVFLVTGLFINDSGGIGVSASSPSVLGFSSPVAVAASTLAAVALFNPLRVRVQHTVDRRFNRARYDAEATIARFTTRLRDAVDLETVRGELLDVVNRAVEPTHASVWIRQRK